MNGSAPGLVLIEKLKSTQKWAINLGTVKKTGKNLWQTFPWCNMNFSLKNSLHYRKCATIATRNQRQRQSYVFMIFRAITSFLSASNSSSCFFLCWCRNMMYSMAERETQHTINITDRHATEIFRGLCYHMYNMDVNMEDNNNVFRKPLRMSMWEKSATQDWLFLDTLGISKTGSDLKLTREELHWEEGFYKGLTLLPKLTSLTSSKT